MKNISFKDYKKVHHAKNESTMQDCVISIHNTESGSFIDGFILWQHIYSENQKKEALKLSTSCND